MCERSCDLEDCRMGWCNGSFGKSIAGRSNSNEHAIDFSRYYNGTISEKEFNQTVRKLHFESDSNSLPDPQDGIT